MSRHYWMFFLSVLAASAVGDNEQFGPGGNSTNPCTMTPVQDDPYAQMDCPHYANWMCNLHGITGPSKLLVTPSATSAADCYTACTATYTGTPRTSKFNLDGPSNVLHHTACAFFALDGTNCYDYTLIFDPNKNNPNGDIGAIGEGCNSVTIINGSPISSDATKSYNWGPAASGSVYLYKVTPASTTLAPRGRVPRDSTSASKNRDYGIFGGVVAGIVMIGAIAVVVKKYAERGN